MIVISLPSSPGAMPVALDRHVDNLEPRLTCLSKATGMAPGAESLALARIRSLPMKLKQQPDDFQVEELTDVFPAAEGEFALYRLEKSGWSTPDAIGAICRRWRLHLNRLSCGGLKDRHAHTIQYLTIRHGPQRGLNHDTVKLSYLGQVKDAFTSRDIRANRFRMVLRRLTEDDVAAMQQALAAVRRDGIPNYFDDQRFGSVGPGQPFMARLLVLGQYEEALRLALSASYEHDRAPQKREKAILNAHWGNWVACRDRLPRGPVRILIDHLCLHPADFRGALARLRPELRGLYLSAYQSHLWNRMLAAWLMEHCQPNQLFPVKLRLGEVPMCSNLGDAQQQALASLSLPLPSARMCLEAADPRAVLVHKVLAEDDIEASQLRVKGIREMFFSRGERSAFFLPANLSHDSAADELQRGHHKLVLSFELPRGCYATLVVKRLVSPTRQRGIGP